MLKIVHAFNSCSPVKAKLKTQLILRVLTFKIFQQALFLTTQYHAEFLIVLGKAPAVSANQKVFFDPRAFYWTTVVQLSRRE